MGFIKAIGESFVGQYHDQFREVIKCDEFDKNVLVRKITTENGVIQDQSRLFVMPAQCAILVDNGAIKDVITEPGMYFMDTSSPTLFQTNVFKGIGKTFLESLKRIAYNGEIINNQCVFFVNLAEMIGNKFYSIKPIIYNDKVWGPIEVYITGEYTFKISNPFNLITNVTGNVDDLTTDNLQNSITPFIISSVISEVANLNVSFDEITKSQDKIGVTLATEITQKIESFGIEISKIVLTSVDVNEKVKASMNERIAIKMKASSVNSEEAETYAKLNQAEAMKDLANNPNSAGTTVMGMNMGNMFGGMIDNKKDNS